MRIRHGHLEFLLAFPLRFKAPIHLENCSIAQVRYACEIRRFKALPSQSGSTPFDCVVTMYLANRLRDFRAAIRRRRNHLGQETKDENLDTYGNQ